MLALILLLSGCARIQPQPIAQGIVQKETHLQTVNMDFTEHNAKVMGEGTLIGAGGGVAAGGAVAVGACTAVGALFAPFGGLAVIGPCIIMVAPGVMTIGGGVGAGTGALASGTVSYVAKIEKQGIGLYKYSVLLKGQKNPVILIEYPRQHYPAGTHVKIYEKFYKYNDIYYIKESNQKVA